ncbi:hypothetical protein BGZ63DRAFT_428166 [Mariannaea sp. PMI_226]|nr:hypothetical protein BGZ63DRAFT_428166 [Mariannaea sp. PMI_226]
MKLLHTLLALHLGISTIAALPATTCTLTKDAEHATVLLHSSEGNPTTAAVAAATATETESSTLLQARQQPSSIPPYKPIVTAAPSQDEALASLGYYQTTYYECRTRGGKEHCGWHIPVMHMESGGIEQKAVRSWQGVVVAALGVAGWMML